MISIAKEFALPPELKECAAGLSGAAVKDQPIKKLSESMSKLAGMSADVQATLNEVEEAIDSDKQTEKEYKAIFYFLKI